jgi:hypothetical protein
MEGIAIRKVTRDYSLFANFVGFKDFWKMVVMLVELLLVVVMVVMIIWHTIIFGSFEVETWRQKALFSCHAVIS